MTDCEGCAYWKSFDWASYNGIKCCHYMFETGSSRAREGNRCLSRKEKEKKEGRK